MFKPSLLINHDQINAVQLLDEIRVSNKRIPQRALIECKRVLVTFLGNYYKSKEIDTILKDRIQVILLYSIFKNDYLFWLGIKISLTPAKNIQPLLDAHLNENYSIAFIDDVEKSIKPFILNFCTWISDSQFNAVETWLNKTDIYTEPETIFKKEYHLRIVLHLRAKLKDPNDIKLLENCIVCNEVPLQPITLNFPSVTTAAHFFHQLISRQCTQSISLSDFAKWVSIRFQIFDGKSKLKTLKSESFLRLMQTKEDKINIPENISYWFSAKN